MTPAPPQDVRSVTVADVLKQDRVVATLTRSAGSVSFAYLGDYLAVGGEPVATTLPLSDRPVVTAAGAVPPFFAGLLPEGRRLSALRRMVKTSADDELSLLLAVGADPVGDVRVLPQGDTAEVPPPLVRVDRDFSELSFREVLVEAGALDRVALAGVQDKASAGVLSVPMARRGRAYLLKIDPPEYPHLVENEASLLALSRRARFPTVRATVVRDAEGVPGLLVERFDRVPTPDGLRRLAVEDGAQVLGRYPADKYAVSAEEVVTALATVCAARAVALRELYRQFCFAWLTGNGDLHAKNVSILQGTDGEWTVAPTYDIPCTLPYGDYTSALPIDGRRQGLSRRRLLAWGEQLGLPRRAATRVLDDVVRATRPLAELWESGGGPFHGKQLRDAVRNLRRRHADALG